MKEITMNNPSDTKTPVKGSTSNSTTHSKPMWDTTPDTHTEELFITQRAFRAVMDAMARPGQLRIIPPLHGASPPAQHRRFLANPWLETLVCMLIDSTCRICVTAPAEDTCARAIAERTYATLTTPSHAHFAVICVDAPTKERARVLAQLSGGSDISPQTGATALIECVVLGTKQVSKAHYEFVVRGPGVREQHVFCASSRWWYDVRKKRNDEFPRGIDLILVDGMGHVVALPRTAQIELQRTQEEKQEDAWKDAQEKERAEWHM